jgi:predicted AlkP superfamily phosphohydrolase/phosphomutase
LAATVPTVLAGLDGATFDIINPMLREGRLPFLRKMVVEGAKATLLSSTPPLSAIAWTTITSGVNPGRHGIYDFAHRQKGSYDFTPYTARDKKAPSLWRMLGEAGKKSCIVNVPLTYPAEQLRGVMLSGFPRPSKAPDMAYPGTLVPELERELGDIDFSKPAGLIRDGQEQKLVEEIRQKTEVQLRVLEYLLKRDSYDFVMTVFDGVDVASHSLWKFIDPLHPKYDPRHSKDVRESLFQAYEISDNALAKLRVMFDGEVDFVAISDHGSGPVYYGVYINNWLADNGYLKFRRNPMTRVKNWSFRHGLNVSNIFRIAKALRILPSFEEAYASRSFALGLVKRFALSFDDIDWKNTRAYSFGNYGQLFVNLKGREPEGIVEPGPEYDLLVTALMDGIRKIKDEKTGEVIFDRLFRGSEVYHGQWESDGPDVLFFDSEMLYNAHRLFELGTSHLVSLHPLYSGNHKSEGVLVASGPGIERKISTTEFTIDDITPTVLALQGVKSKYEADGEVMKEILRAPGSHVRTVGEGPQKETAEAKQAFSEQEAAELTDRLKDLGYI